MFRVASLFRRLVEAVPDAAHREDVARLLGIALDLRAELLDEVVDRARRAVVVGAPDAPEDVVAREHATLLVDDAEKDVELARGHLHGLAAAAHAPRGDVHLDVPERDAPLPLRLRRAYSAAPERRAHAREELGQAERLGDVVLRAELEAGDFVHLAGLRR